MASSFSDSSGARETLLPREVIPLDEGNSSERTASAVGEEKSSEGTPSPTPHSTAIPVAPLLPIHRSRKRKSPQPKAAHPGPSSSSKRVRKNPQPPPIADLEYSWVHNDVNKHSSIYNTRDRVGRFVAVYPVCEDSFVEYALVGPCRTRERMYMRPGPNSYDFIYVYDYMFKEYDMRFPLTNFEVSMLRLMNIAPSQLHPNSWAFIKCFKLLCDQLGLQSSINIFTHFYQMKFGKRVGWVSLSTRHSSPLFTLYNSSYKHFKPRFFKLHCHPEDTEKRILFHSDHTPHHPLYWQRPRRFQPRPDYQFTVEEKTAIDAIRQLPRPLQTRALLYLPLVEDPDALFLGMSDPMSKISTAFVFSNTLFLSLQKSWETLLT